MTVLPRHPIGGKGIRVLTLATTLAFSTLGAVARPWPAGADQITDKQAEAASIATKLDDQAQRIVALDVQYRSAQDQLDDAQSAVAQAQTELDAATRRQSDLKQQLVAQAQDAYVVGGSVSVLQFLVRSNKADEVARRTYLRIVTGEDRLVIGQLKATREDLAALRDRLTAVQRVAKARADAIAADRDSLDKAIRLQKAQLSQVTGDLTQLVAAEQARRDAAAAEAARQAAATAPTPAPAPAPVPKSAPAATNPPVVLQAPGDDTFACIRQLESGDNYAAPGGGAYQFLDSTWHALGYTGTAGDAPPAVQDAAAHQLQAQSGWSPWTTSSLCGRT